MGGRNVFDTRVCSTVQDSVRRLFAVRGSLAIWPAPAAVERCEPMLGGVLVLAAATLLICLLSFDAPKVAAGSLVLVAILPLALSLLGHRHARASWRKVCTDWPLVVFWAYGLATACWASHSAAISRAAAEILCVMGVYAAIVLIARRHSALAVALWGRCLIVATAAGLIALVVAHTSGESQFYSGRLWPTVGAHSYNPNLMARLYAFNAICLLIWVTSNGWQSWGSPRLCQRWRWSAVIASLLSAGLLAMTHSRTMMLGLAAAAVATAGLAPRRRCAITMLAGLLVVMSAAIQLGPYFSGWRPKLSDAGSMGARVDRWTAFSTRFAEHPIVGCGYDALSIVAKSGETYWHAHNLWLTHAVTGGLIGLGLSIWVTVVTLLRMRRTRNWVFWVLAITFAPCLLIDCGDAFVFIGTEWFAVWSWVLLAAALGRRGIAVETHTCEQSELPMRVAA